MNYPSGSSVKKISGSFHSVVSLEKYIKKVALIMNIIRGY